MKAMAYKAAELLVLIVAAGVLGACNHELFTESDNRTDRSLRYYDNDSATETTQARKQSVGSPFGMPSGSAQQ